MPSILKVKYPKISVKTHCKGQDGPLTFQNASELIGWIEEPVDEDWKNDYVLKDTYGKKIRLLNNPTNRPFKAALASRYANEHLRGKWSMNLETIVISEHGFVLQGQHRLVGFILGEQQRQLNPTKWGKSPLLYETLVGFGASSKPVNANTYDLGSKRSLSDVVYRHQKFGKKVTDKQQKRISNVLAGAIRLVWLRAGGKQVSFAPHFPHSEALDFYSDHKGIYDSVQNIVHMDEGEGLVSLGYASALHYLMQGATDEGTANAFWQAVATGESLKKGSPIHSLRQYLIKSDASTGGKRDELIGTIIKAWLLWIAKKPGTLKQIRVAKKKKGDKFVLAEFPRIGGIDSDVEVSAELSIQQLLIIKALKTSKKEMTYKELQALTGLTAPTLGKAILATTKDGENVPQSLAHRKLVAVTQYEPQEGEKSSPFYFKLTALGRK